jgi:conflict system STAND superfamily ATPase/PDZ domain-containing protein
LRRTPDRAELVDRFIEARLLVADRSPGGPATVRVAHDALLRLWPRLRDWMASNAATLRLRALIAASAVIWRNQGGSASFLLPAGEALAYAARLQQESPQELTRDEAEYIARSLALARRLERRRRTIRASQAAAVLLLVALAAGYWDAYHRERVEHYSSSLLRWGLPEGIGALSPDAWSTRAQTTRIRRTGRLGPIELVVLDEHGNCTAPDWGPTGSYDIDAEALEEVFSASSLSSNEEKPEPCRWDFNRRWTGAVDTVNAFDAKGQSLFRVKYDPDRIDRASFVNDKGYVSARFKTGAGVVEFSYASAGPHAGLIEAVHLFDAYGSPQPDANGTCGARNAYDDRGFVDRVGVLNCQWEPMLMKLGMAGFQVTFDPRGFFTGLRLLGLDGQLVTTTELGAQWHVVRDSHGRMTDVSVRDAENRLVLSPRIGIARMTMRYDDRGRLLEGAFFDAANKLTTSPSFGCARLLYAYESHGEVSGIECRGPDGKLAATQLLGSVARVEAINDVKGTPRERKFFDEADRLVLWRFDDEQGNLRLDKDAQFAQRIVSYDEKRGADGQLYQLVTLRHDDPQEQELFTLSIIGDASGNEVKALYTRDDKPIVREGYHSRTSSYTAKGWLEEMRYFDVAGRPCLTDNGYARVRFTHDEKGQVRKATYFDQAGRELATRVVIRAIAEESPAARAGLKVDDVIVRYQDRPIEIVEQLVDLTGREGTDVRQLVVERGGQQVSINVPAGRLGITVVQRAK